MASSEEIEEFLGDHPDWERQGDEIVASYECGDFVGSMGLVTRIALLAEKADHHPDIDIRWDTVSLRLSTHSEGGLTQKDFQLAAEIAGLLS